MTDICMGAKTKMPKKIRGPNIDQKLISDPQNVQEGLNDNTKKNVVN